MTRTRGGGYRALVKLLPGQRCQSAVSGICVIWVLTGTAWALDPQRHVTQFGHSAWRAQDGFISRSLAVTQTADGYVWIATLDGLVRFDGVKFSPWSPAAGESLPNAGFGSKALLGARDGSLWIGTSAGLSRLKDGHLFNYTTTARSPGIGAIAEDRKGTIWVTRYFVNDGMGPLCRVDGERLRCYGQKDGLVATTSLGLAVQPDGTLWFTCQMVCRFSAGVFTSYFDEQLKAPAAGYGAIDIVAEPSGSVWAAFYGPGPRLGVQHYADGKWAPFVVPGFDGGAVRSRVLFVDRDRTLWVGTESTGLYRVHDGHADHFERSDGLSGNDILSMYEDREGNLWVITGHGIDMFYDTSVVTFSTNEGLVGSDVNSVLALRDGTVWVGTQEALNIIDGNSIRSIDSRHGLPGQNITSLFEDSAGRVWLGVANTVMNYESGRFLPIARADGRPLTAMGQARAFAEDRDGSVWALMSVTTTDPQHLLRIKDRRVVEDISVGTTVSRAYSLAADQREGVWIAGALGEFARIRNGKADVVVRLETPDGQVTGYSLSVDSNGSVWFATNRGLYRWQDGRVSLLDSRNGLPCLSIYSAIGDDEGAFWLYARCGLLRITASDWAAWLKSPDHTVSAGIFDLHDGAQPALSPRSQPVVSKSPDGRLWFVGAWFVQMIDPRRIHTNTVPPPVRIEAIVADGKNYTTVAPPRLPPLPRQLEIEYTALSFKFPQKVRFRYKLEGQDSDWHDAGVRRQALYNDLRPNTYRFRVVASNDAGVWNEVGAVLDFTIEPAWFQTRSFAVAIGILVLLAAIALYRLRVRQIARTMNARFDDQLAERTRVARDIHDTLLQTVQGSKLVADHALKNTGDHDQLVRAMEQLAEWLAQANEEGRAAVNSLRTSTTESNDLADAFRRALDECRAHADMKVSLSLVGDTRGLHPVLRDEIYRIGYEAIRNACQHSMGRVVDVLLEYAHDLTVRVRDDGVGIDPTVLETGKDGHFGLRGMRERATHIGGRLAIESAPRSGTAVTLIVPGRVAFTTASRPSQAPTEKRSR
jgi:signal transduction histidine kinase/ligand-binding sensor domain-containing protein